MWRSPPLTGARVETNVEIIAPPSRGRGLKPCRMADRMRERSPPLTGARVETDRTLLVTVYVADGGAG